MSGWTILRARIVGDTSWVLFGQISTALLLLAGIRVLTELVPPDVYGQVALIMSLVVVANSVCGTPLITAGERYYSELAAAQRVWILRQTLVRLTSSRIALAAVLFIVGGTIFSRAVDINPLMFVAAATLLVATTYREFEVHMLIAGRYHKEASLWQTTDALARPLLAVAVVFLFGANPLSVLLGYLLAIGLVNVMWRRIFCRSICDGRQGLRGVDAELGSRIHKFAWPLVPMQLLNCFNGFGDRFIIAALLSVTQVGVYAATYTLINEAFYRSAVGLQRIFRPVYFSCYANGDHGKANRVYVIWIGLVALMGITGVVLLILFKDWVAMLLLADTYQSAANLMPLIGAGTALFILGDVFQFRLLAAERTHAVLIGRMCGVIAALCTIPALTAAFGLMGAAAACPVYYGVEAICLGIIAKPWRMRENMTQTPLASSMVGKRGLGTVKHLSASDTLLNATKPAL